MASPHLEFGTREPSLVYRDRPAAFGVCVREGRVAVVRVAKPGKAPWFDLPGGAVDPGEDERQAVVREFGEETGLVVRPGDAAALARAINTLLADPELRRRMGAAGQRRVAALFTRERMVAANEAVYRDVLAAG
jgi:8-oxo-dGTP pyrophosphatase MutT (NUDIX family)